ncbi:hypothetical protein GDO81_029181 [Engystomops pustulosus]|uniref:MOFRL-associated domain-containing protein n=2 Tax=Engystomops pustulosus TaxID=76066 RepID=A0AAV6YCG6_ENGPU|nr:hypothetical protein GDO81_029181 [Engystomops pustulosus]
MAGLFRVTVRRLISSRTLIPTRSMAALQDDAHRIFWSAVSAVLPPRMLRRALTVRETPDSSLLECGGRAYTLQKNLYLVGCGKAVLGMAAAVEQIIGSHLVEGVISIPRGMEKSLREAGKR